MTLPVKFAYLLSDCPNFHKSGSITGMRARFYGKDAQLIRCGSYIYNVTRNRNLTEILNRCTVATRCFA